MYEQLEFQILNGEHSDDMLQEAQYQSCIAARLFMHRGAGWYWDDRLIVKEAEEAMDEDDDESCHFQLFGPVVYRVRFRGWFKAGILTVMDRIGECRSMDQIPEQLLRHLLDRFKIPFTQTRFY